MPIHSVIALTRDLDTPLTVAPLRHHLVSGDDLGDRFDIAITRGGEAVHLTGASIVAYFIRSADGYTIPIPGSASGHVATVTLPESCYTVPGRFTLTVKAALDGVNHALWVGEGAVLRASTEALVDPGHTIPDIDELLGMIGQIEAAVDNANTAAGNAAKATASATTAADKADKAAASATTAAQAAALWGNVTTTVSMLDASASPTVTITDVSSGKRMAFQLPRGLTGATPNLKIGTVKTGEPGTSVIATIAGTAEAPLLNLTIPRGDAGSIDSLTINGVHADSGTISLSPSDLGAVNRAGDTMSGALYVEMTTPRIGVTGTTANQKIDLRVAANGNRGLYDETAGSWIVCKTGDAVRLYGSADTLSTPRKISGVPFDGSADIDLTPSDVGAVWKAGDTVTFGAMALSGYVTSSTANMYVSVCLGKPVTAQTATVTAFSGEIRSAKGYVDGSGSKDLTADYSVSVSSLHRETGNLVILIQKGSAFDNVDNNTVVSVRAISLAIRLS